MAADRFRNGELSEQLEVLVTISRGAAVSYLSNVYSNCGCQSWDVTLLPGRGSSEVKFTFYGRDADKRAVVMGSGTIIGTQVTTCTLVEMEQAQGIAADVQAEVAEV